MRAIFEFLMIVFVILAARAVFTSIMQGIARASSNSFPNAAQGAPRGQTKASASEGRGGDLHKDPVCGTYVAESSSWRRQAGGQTFYYCSESCREKHSLVAH